MKYKLNAKFDNRNIVRSTYVPENEIGEYSVAIKNGIFTLQKLDCDGKCILSDCHKLNICHLSHEDEEEFKSIMRNDIITELKSLHMNKHDIVEIMRRTNIILLIRSKWVEGLSYDEVVRQKAFTLAENFYKTVKKVSITKDNNGINNIVITNERIKRSDHFDVLFPNICERLFCPVYTDTTKFDRYHNVLFSYKTDDDSIESFIKENILDIYSWAMTEILSHDKSIRGLKANVFIQDHYHQVLIKFRKPDNEVVPMYEDDEY